jgi:hypothetical protein
VNEFDALVLTPVGLVLIEVKSRPGSLRGDAYSWTWTTEGRPVTTDNPLNVSPRSFADNGQRSRRTAGRALDPAADILVHCSSAARARSWDREAGRAARFPGSLDDPGVIGMLLRSEELALGRGNPAGPTATRAWVQAIEQAGIRPPGRGRRVGDYELGQLLGEGDNWQDFAALPHRFLPRVAIRAKLSICMFSGNGRLKPCSWPNRKRLQPRARDRAVVHPCRTTGAAISHNVASPVTRKTASNDRCYCRICHR